MTNYRNQVYSVKFTMFDSFLLIRPPEFFESRKFSISPGIPVFFRTHNEVLLHINFYSKELNSARKLNICNIFDSFLFFPEFFNPGNFFISESSTLVNGVGQKGTSGFFLSSGLSYTYVIAKLCHCTLMQESEKFQKVFFYTQ